MNDNSEWVDGSPLEGGSSSQNQNSKLEAHQGQVQGNRGTMTFFGDEGSKTQSGFKQGTAYEQKGSRKNIHSPSDSNTSTPIRFPTSNHK
jgi:hypothetical protein